MLSMLAVILSIVCLSVVVSLFGLVLILYVADRARDRRKK